MVIVETRTFTRLITELLPDENYRGLQSALVLRPERQADLTPKQVRQLGQVVQEELR